jgi:EF-P beta-lysylation protein EpmB
MIIDSVLVNEENAQNSAFGSAWQQSLREMIRSPEALLQALDLPQSLLDSALPGHRQFPLRVTRSFVARMQKGNPQDPLLLQVLPLQQETETDIAGYTTDPLQEKASIALPGMLHKYSSRVLMISTSACAIHCRYCFRRHFPYDDQRQSQAELATALEYIEQNPSVREVILSGGDPLMLNDELLGRQLALFAAAGNVQTLRLHTRLPVVLPERVTDDLLDVLANFGKEQGGKNVVVVIHANHPNEINDEVLEGLHRLRRVATLLNQTVLLKAINDDAATQAALHEKLFTAGVLPYYLHQMDAVAGTHHFAVSDARALTIHQQLTASLPGYLVPRLVREEAGAASKSLLGMPRA